MSESNDLLSKIESRRLWAYWHKDWLLEIRDQVRRQLPRSYSLFVESEAILVSPAGEGIVASTLPDLGVARPEPGAAAPAAGNATAAVLDVEETCEVFVQYSLLVRRTPDNRLIAACEILSPTNKGAFGPLEREKYLRKRTLYAESGVNLLEIDALLRGDRLLPPALEGLGAYLRHAWTSLHRQEKRRLRGWGWNGDDPLPVVPWDIEDGRQALVDLPAAFEQASQFNDWAALAGP